MNTIAVSPRQKYLVAGFFGLLGGFAFPPLPLGVLAFFVFVPLIFLLEAEPQRTNRILYSFFFCFHGAANWWVMSWQKETDPFLMIAGAALWLGHPFFLMPAFWVMKYLRRRYSFKAAVLFLPLLWTSFEWLHSLSDASYPWLALGYTQVYHTILIQVASLTGVWGVGFLVMTVNCSLILFITAIRNGGLRNGQSLRFVWLGVVLVAIWLGHGFYALSNKSDQSKPVMCGVVQPNINPWRKWQGGIREMMDKHIYLQDSLNREQRCQLSVWPETAIPIDLNDPTNIAEMSLLHQWADSSQTGLLIGFADFVYYPRDKAPASSHSLASDPDVRFRVFNSVGLLSPNMTSVPIHHKSKLTPFGEGIPFADELTFLQSWLNWGVGISGWSKGEGATALPLKSNNTTASVGPVICIESIYPNFVADYVRRGAEMLVVVTNDAWYDGTFGPEQHFCIARMRAAETHRWIARSGNSGVSGFISANGQSIEQAPTQKALALQGKVYLQNDQTIYVRLGDWLPQLCMAVSIVMVLFSFRRKAGS